MKHINCLDIFTSKRIFFAHQSVGKNILDGIYDLYGENAFKIPNIINYMNNNLDHDNFLLHCNIGRNKEPLSKCEEFIKIIDATNALSLEYACLKFCYIDINVQTNIEELFNRYINIIEQLSKKHPQITFIHCTIPLRNMKSSLSIRLRELIGRPNRDKLDNIKREDYNQLIRNHYKSDYIYDIAKQESVISDNKWLCFSYQGKKYLNLNPKYTYDGGHLNKIGRQKLAADFIALICRIEKQS